LICFQPCFAPGNEGIPELLIVAVGAVTLLHIARPVLLFHLHHLLPPCVGMPGHYAAMPYWHAYFSYLPNDGRKNHLSRIDLAYDQIYSKLTVNVDSEGRTGQRLPSIRYHVICLFGLLPSKH
jgi:hypothetical protein